MIDFRCKECGEKKDVPLLSTNFRRITCSCGMVWDVTFNEKGKIHHMTGKQSTRENVAYNPMDYVR